MGIAPKPFPGWFPDLMRVMSGLGGSHTWPKPAPQWARDEHEAFKLWNDWKNNTEAAGHPRPSNVWRVVPQWLPYFTPWDLRKLLIGKTIPPVHLPTTPPPLPTPAVPPFPMPFAFSAWGRTSGEYTNVQTAISKLKEGGFRTVLLQIGQGWEYADGKAFRDADIEPVLWGIAFDAGQIRDEKVTLGVAKWVAQIEDRTQHAQLMACINAGQIPCAVVVTGGGVETETDAAPLVAAGIKTVLPEAYASIAPEPYGDLPLMTWQFGHLAAWNSIPVISCCSQDPPRTGQAHPHDHKGFPAVWPNAGMWLLEEASDADLAELKAAA